MRIPVGGSPSPACTRQTQALGIVRGNRSFSGPVLAVMQHHMMQQASAHRGEEGSTFKADRVRERIQRVVVGQFGDVGCLIFESIAYVTDLEGRLRILLNVFEIFELLTGGLGHRRVGRWRDDHTRRGCRCPVGCQLDKADHPVHACTHPVRMAYTANKLATTQDTGAERSTPA